MASIGQVLEFNPDSQDWTIYQERLEQYFKVNKITEELQVATLLSVVGDSTYQILRDLTYPSPPKNKTYEQLADILQKHFAPTVSVLKERVKFYNYKQENQETISEFNIKIRRMAGNCKFDARLMDILKDKLVSGIKPGKVQERLCEEDETKSYGELLAIAKKSEEMTNIHQQMEVNMVKPKRSYKTGWKDNGRVQNGADYSQQSKSSFNSIQKCSVCGKNHKSECRYRHFRCRKCNKVGHLETMCKNKDNKKYHQNVIEQDYSSDEEEDSSLELCNFEICNITGSTDDTNDFKMLIKIRNVNINMAVDTGAAITVINIKTYNRYFKDIKLKKEKILLKSYTGHIIAPLGYFYSHVIVKNVKKYVKFYVVNTQGPNLIGRDFMHTFNIKLNCKNVSTVNNFAGPADRIIDKYPGVFNDKIGEYKYAKVNVAIKQNVNPVFQKPRPMPLAYRKEVEEQLKKMVKEDIIEQIPASSWGTQIVIVHKKNGSLRICGNYKRTVNQYLENVKYPLPRIEEIFDKVRDGKYFCRLDLNGAYNQLVLDEESQELLALSTHMGIFKQKRMPFGITTASAIFQRTIEQLIQGMVNVASYQDDIIVAGRTMDECSKNLELVLKKLEDAGLTVNKDKCELFKQKLEYLGHVITKDGLQKSEMKVKAIADAPRPHDIHSVRSFCGLVQYYSKFLPNLSTILKPIYQLIQKDRKFKWTQQCEQAFNTVKKMIAQDITLARFNPEKPIILMTDASKEGISAILYQKESHGIERPIACTSRTLMPQEKSYATIDLEALAIIHGCKKFSNYLLGIPFIIRTDHMPLIGLFKENKEIPQRHKDRLQRWAVYLSGFNYKLEHVKGKNNWFADCLSRIPIPSRSKSDEDVFDGFLNYAETVDEWPLDNDKVKQLTAMDPELCEVREFIKNGWPKSVPEEMWPYHRRREELYIDNDCILWGRRVIIPDQLRKIILKQLHDEGGHLGIAKTKSIARTYMWWPKMDQQIVDTVGSCNLCYKCLPEPPKAESTPWPKENKPFNRVHMDFFQIGNKNFLVVVDAYTKWLEVFEMRTTESSEVIKKLETVFATFGNPKCIVSDNGPNLVSKILQRFFNKNGIKRLTSPPYSPKSNGQAEICVKTVKSKLKLVLANNPKKENTSTLLNKFLFSYRNAVHSTTGKTPSEMMFGRKVRTKFNLLQEKSTLESQFNNNQNKTKGPEFQEGDNVIVRDYRISNSEKWAKAKIYRRRGKAVYLCKTEEGEIWKRHRDQMRRSIVKTITSPRKPVVEKIKESFRIAYNANESTEAKVNDNSGTNESMNNANEEESHNEAEVEEIVNPIEFQSETLNTENRNESTTHGIKRPTRNRKKPKKLEEFLDAESGWFNAE